MTDEKKKEESKGKDPLTIPEVIWAAARWLAERELLTRLAVVAFLVVLGAAGLAYAQDAGAKYIAPIEARVTALEKNQADMQRMTVETNATVKVIAIKMGITPIVLPAPDPDGGR